MVRELRRLLLSPERLNAAAATLQLPLEPDERHYLSRVLRLRRGDPLAVVDGQGHLWQATLDDQQALLLQPPAQPLLSEPPPAPTLQLAVALPRRDSDVLLRMATELGLDRLVPLLADRSVNERWNGPRARQILREAVEQCERLWAPELDEPQAAAAWFKAPPPSPGPVRRLLATTRQSGLPQLPAVLAVLETPTAITLAIGPEGGWSPAEEALAQEQGWQAVGLGSNILRTSTAAVAAATLLCSWRQGLSS